MIKANSDDLQKLKEICPQGHLIIATSNYRGFRNFLGFIAQYIVNPIQWFTGAFYDNLTKYIAHVFIIFYKDEELFVGEMDKKSAWKVNLIKKSNTFLKITKGQIRIFDLGVIEDQEIDKLCQYGKTQRYSLLHAISSLKLFRFLNIFISKKDRFESNKCHCGSVFLKYQPFHKYFKTTGKNFFRKYKTHHPEAVDHYLKNNFDLKIVKIRKGKLCL